MRALGLASVAAALLLVGVQPAAASSTPSKVGLVSFVAAGYSSKSASLTIDWPNASRATSYQIFVSRHGTMSHATKYTSRSSSFYISHLLHGTDYFFQVRGVNGSKVGAKSTHVGHTTIRDSGHSNGTAYRVMTYNVCSRVCDQEKTTKYTWDARQPGALARVASYVPDVLAAQEANFLATPDGYEQAIYKSGKRLFFKTSRFDLAPADADPLPTPPNDGNGCSPTWGNGATGYVFLGFHGHHDPDPAKDTRGCRYGVWAELVDKTNGKHVIFVDVHTVAGERSTRADERKVEIQTLFAAIDTVNHGDALPVVFAGDFNSNKSRTHDYPATVMHQNGFYDAYDLARSLNRQHYNSYNSFLTTPRISYTWGDHLDHVWVMPGTARVNGWRNGALIVNGRLPQPIASDHSPVVVDLQLD